MMETLILMHSLRFRQIHLDFHTSSDISNIGSQFDKKRWQETLQAAHVDSITCFSKCHHGWSYHETTVGRKHPGLTLDLLRAQFDACKEIDINVPVYLSAGTDELIRKEHPEWVEFDAQSPCDFFAPGFRKICFNTPYLDYLCDQIAEAVALFPNANGIFLDIINQGTCCCQWCLDSLKKMGLDPEVKENRLKHAQIVLENYLKKTTAAARTQNPNMSIFHNSGNILRGRRNLLKYVSHLELESLPTGGWGYDHFPISAKYVSQLGLDYLGMTGKFHTTWGEFGGYKHPNALRYECSAMLAYGAKCSIGDQLSPLGQLDKSTYNIIGTAYGEVEAKEPWCRGSQSVADIGVLSSAAVTGKNPWHNEADTGAGRILLEGHFLFDVLDAEMDFSKYKVLILPDDIRVSETLKSKLQKYLTDGGKLFLTGTSGLNLSENTFAFDIGAEDHGENEFVPDYVLPCDSLRPTYIYSPTVMYYPSRKIKVTNGRSLGNIFNPYFNRTFTHFNSHQHAPAQPNPSGFDSGVIKGNILYLAHPVFINYYAYGAVPYREYVVNALKMLVGNDISLRSNLPSIARTTLTQQKKEHRYILHLLYGPTATVGGHSENSPKQIPFKSKEIQIIEDLPPLYDIRISLKLPRSISRVVREPQGSEIPFTLKDGRVEFTIDSFSCHQMVILS
jgi:hypothetical protein